MPIHISEIGVRLAVGGAAGPAPEPSTEDQRPGGAGLTQAQVQEIVNASVQQVLRNLRAREER